MTIAQITAILGTDRLNRWVDISKDFNIITFISEKKIFLMENDVCRQLYFDTTSGNLYVRFTNGRLIVPPEDENITIPANHVSVVKDGKTYWVKLVSGGVVSKTSGIGRYHDVWFIDHIAGIFAPL
jgi:hypothetical protein